MNPTSPFDSHTELLSKVLDLRARKAQVISTNIANAETPGFAAVRFDFEQELSAALASKKTPGLRTTHNEHIPLGAKDFDLVNGRLRFEKTAKPIGDGNAVSLDQEMLALSENELLYEVTTQLLQKKLAQLKYVISGGQ